MHKIVRLFFGLWALAGITFAHADLGKVKSVEEKQIVAFPDGIQGKPVYLKTIKAKIDPPYPAIGELQRGWLCMPSGKIYWSPQLFRLVVGGFTKTFREELVKAHYPVPKVSDAIFDEQDKTQTSTDLQVGLLIKDVQANLCAKSDSTEGGVYMKIFWQVFSPELQKVVFETTTEGTYQPAEPESGPLTTLFGKAFAMATRNLLADRGFYDVLAGTSKAVDAATSPEPIALKFAKPSAGPLEKNMTLLRSAVVTIVSDNGSGSGFFITQEGYLLTNWHVVGNSRFVKVKLLTGRDLVGEVIRSDKARDVALVKTEPIADHPISLRVSEPNVGESVFALGSPLGDKFNTSVTRGIVSGYRTLDESRYLQSDVAILPGDSGGPLLDANGAVIGITRMGLGARGLAGMNFFIPITDALARLGIQANMN